MCQVENKLLLDVYLYKNSAQSFTMFMRWLNAMQKHQNKMVLTT
jgi:hypothetical protein